MGRTGAGKSSIIAALFRMSDQISGAITIDGLNTADIPLHNLRSVLAIIPQVGYLTNRRLIFLVS